MTELRGVMKKGGFTNWSEQNVRSETVWADTMVESEQNVTSSAKCFPRRTWHIGNPVEFEANIAIEDLNVR